MYDDRLPLYDRLEKGLKDLCKPSDRELLGPWDGLIIAGYLVINFLFVITHNGWG